MVGCPAGWQPGALPRSIRPQPGEALMPIPLIPVLIGAASAVLAAIGVTKGTRGVRHMRQAKTIVVVAKGEYEGAAGAADAEKAGLNCDVDAYLVLQTKLLRGTCKRFIELVARIGNRGTVTDLEALEAIGLDIKSLAKLKVQVLQADELAIGGVAAVSAGTATAAATTSLVALLATASTGTAIGGLSGAAANSAILAWLGGGSLAAGGGGLAVGSVVLGGVVAGPSLAVAGWVIADQGEKALTKAREQEAKAAKAAAELCRLTLFLGRVRVRVGELSELATALDARAATALDVLEQLSDFDVGRKEHVRLFQRAAVCVSGLSAVIRTPLIDDGGGLNEETATLVKVWRTVAAEEQA